ncbi:MAG: DUF418 domain-containing protein [Acidobacteria bacterium]|nr:DUF418 domain-containing protein [Acidobacteriota bacterium]MYF15128.1 DUF418 domain-containing protein [Acidobacteriota bacterium]MYI96348.1 DUF418 domain-containing protein [Acidobacteriota bacterium]
MATTPHTTRLFIPSRRGADSSSRGRGCGSPNWPGEDGVPVTGARVPPAGPVPGPTPAGERLPLLDAVRGAALAGILLANLMSFFAVFMLDAEQRQAMSYGWAGEHVLFAVNWLVEGKFYSVFSILLGIGFALQAGRSARRGASPADFARFFRRRMWVLVAIGLVHMVFMWAGDILTLYGVMGLLLPSLARLKGGVRAALIAALFLVPLGTHALIVSTEGRLDPRTPFAAAGTALRERAAGPERTALDLFAHGSGADYYVSNVSTAVVRPGAYLQQGRPAKVLFLFVLGAWLGAGVLPRLGGMRRALWLTVVLGGVVGLAGSFVYATIKAATDSTFLMSGTGLLQTAAYTFGTAPLALAYLAAAALAWRLPWGRSGLGWFVPLGRMALTVYLTQSVVQVAIFTSLGLGLAGRAPVVWIPAVAALVLVAQRYGCAWWLARHERGPAEWVWRRLTYGGGRSRSVRA